MCNSKACWTIRMYVLVLGVLLTSQALGNQQDYCYAEDENPYLMFATKTAYEFVHEKPRNPENVPHCQPLQFWLLSRHGTRFPDEKDIAMMERLPELRDQILRNHETRRQGRLCEEDLKNLRNWSIQVFPTQANFLANQGYDDMKFMARRFKSQFPTLLNKTFSEDTYVFRTTDTQRTKASAKAFAEGLFGPGSHVFIPEPLKNDPLLKGYDTCERWKMQVDDNNDTFQERRLFEMGPEMQELLRNVSARLGFQYQLPYKKIDDMYEMCRFDKAWNIRHVSPWCAVFSRQELQLLEYREDLSHYYNAGYGNEFNVRLGCPLVKDFIHRFSQIEQRNAQPSGVFYLSHSKMIEMLLSRLEIAKDPEHLTHQNYNQMKGRRWRTSTLSPFSSNLAVVFFKCDVGEMYRVMFFIGEKLLNYKGCNVGLCNWSFIKDKFERIAEDCSLDICSPDYSGAGKLCAASWMLFAAATVILYAVLNKHM